MLIFYCVFMHTSTVPDAARTSVERPGNENVRNMTDMEEEKLVPSPDNLRRSLLLCGPIVFLSCGKYYPIFFLHGIMDAYKSKNYDLQSMTEHQ